MASAIYAKSLKANFTRSPSFPNSPASGSPASSQGLPPPARSLPRRRRHRPPYSERLGLSPHVSHIRTLGAARRGSARGRPAQRPTEKPTVFPEKWFPKKNWSLGKIGFVGKELGHAALVPFAHWRSLATVNSTLKWLETYPIVSNLHEPGPRCIIH